LDYIV